MLLESVLGIAFYLYGRQYAVVFKVLIPLRKISPKKYQLLLLLTQYYRLSENAIVV